MRPSEVEALDDDEEESRRRLIFLTWQISFPRFFFRSFARVLDMNYIITYFGDNC